ncbi:MAG: RsmE family RNA methyltransferase [Kiritimatiellia bacterium]
MHRCFVPPKCWHSQRLFLSPEEAHYLLHVRRAKLGETVEVFDGSGRVAVARIEPRRAAEQHVPELSRGEAVVLSVLEETRASEPALRVTLVQALPKAAKMDFIVEKATELGVTQIIPVECERIVPHRDARQTYQRLQRWRRIALEAARQCRANRVPEVAEPVSFNQILTQCREYRICLIATLHGETPPLKSVLRGLDLPRPAAVGLMIGPEGDFSPKEVERAREAGAVPVRLGPLVLRVETAAVFALGILFYELA